MAPLLPRDPRDVEDALGLAGRSLLDRYEVGGPIARGGMAIIYEGRDRRLFRPVSIKVFHRLRPGEAAYRTAYDHFVQEAFALSQCSHPNTLRIYDFGYLEGDVAAPFFVSELLEGGTLTQLVRRHGALGPADALEILEPVAGALAEAHARGIVHRDIKPSNILFGLAGPRRIVKLCDFGIAKVVDVAADPDAALSPFGADDGDWRAEDTHLGAGMPLRLYSPGWAAPEQVRGEPIGPAADIYALGLLAGYVLAGHAVAAAPRQPDEHGERPVPSELVLAASLADTTIAAPLAEVIRAACRDRVEDRLASAEAFALALRRAVKQVAGAAGEGETDLYRRGFAFAATEVAAIPDGAPAGAPPPVASAPAPAPALGLAVAPLAVAPPHAAAPMAAFAAPMAAFAAPMAASAAPMAPADPHAPIELDARDLVELPPPPLVIDPDGSDEFLVAGRRMKMVPLGGVDHQDLGGDGPFVRSAARFRVTLMPSRTAAPRLNVKGLNCFVVKAGARPSTAIDVEVDMDVDLIAPDRRPLDGVRCSVGRPGHGARLYELGPVTIAVPAAAGAVMLDLGPGRELALLHRGAGAAARAQGRRR